MRCVPIGTSVSPLGGPVCDRAAGGRSVRIVRCERSAGGFGAPEAFGFFNSAASSKNFGATRDGEEQFAGGEVTALRVPA